MSFRQTSKFATHYCTLARSDFEEQKSGGEVYVMETLETDLYKVGKSLSAYDRFKLFQERKVTFPGSFPLLTVPKGRRNLDFGLFGDRNGNREIKKILKEKILKGAENKLVLPKRIKCVDKSGMTQFYLNETVLKPTSKKFIIADVDDDHFSVSLKKPPRLSAKRTIGQTIIDSLRRLRSYMEFTKGQEHPPHQLVYP